MASISLRPDRDAAWGVAARNPLPPAFDNAGGEAAYMAAYDANMRFWPVAYEPIDVLNRFGRTHLVVSGPTDAPPLVLLHGFCAGLTMWWPNVADLSRDYRVYAVDVIGQPGKSVPARAIASRAEYVEWLSALLDALRIERTFLAGMSYGGWLTLGYAIAAPERLRRIALLSPAGGFAPLVDEFYLRSGMLLATPTRAIAGGFMDWAAAADLPSEPAVRDRYERLVDQFYLGVLHFRREYMASAIPPGTFADEALRSVRVPTLLLIGEKEPLYDPRAAFDRAAALVPDLHGELVPHSSHLMSLGQARLVDAHVRAFLSDATLGAGPLAAV